VQVYSPSIGQPTSAIILEGEDVTRANPYRAMGTGASQVAGYPRVREGLVGPPAGLFREAPGLVADGR